MGAQTVSSMTRRQTGEPVSSHVVARLEAGHFEQVNIRQDPRSGLRAIIAVHSTRRGPALGGVRMWPYPSLESALQDVLRLAQAMTYKAAVSNLPLGGGKAVIVGDPTSEKRPVLLEAFARQVHDLGGRYVTAEDMGMTVQDMECIRRVTPYVTGTPLSHGGSGDPSIMTALGVSQGLRAALHAAGLLRRVSDSLQGLRVAIQGFGKVGSRLAGLLQAQGARLAVADLDRRRVREAVSAFGAEAVEPERIHRVSCDAFAPCGLGGVLNSATIRMLRCRVVAGAANNQLATEEDGERLHRRGILYAPDYVINAGGIINIAVGLRPEGYERAEAERQTRGISRTLGTVCRIARSRRWSTTRAAAWLAERRLRTVPRWAGS